jgi:NADPH:quinone reductase-like Zn-dependent oxidoreductase
MRRQGLAWLVIGMLTACGGSAVVTPRFSQPNVEYLAELMEAGAYRPVIDRVYPLDQVVDAARYVETERKTGNVVLSVT